MTNLHVCLHCNAVYKFSETHECAWMTKAPASPWDPNPIRKVKRVGADGGTARARGTRNRPRRPVVLLSSRPAMRTPKAIKERKKQTRCIYCGKTGADVEIRTEAVSMRMRIVVYKHKGCAAPPASTSVQCVECGAELGATSRDGHRPGCPFGSAVRP